MKGYIKMQTICEYKQIRIPINFCFKITMSLNHILWIIRNVHHQQTCVEELQCLTLSSFCSVFANFFLVPEEYELKRQFVYCLKSCIKSKGLIEKITTLILRNPSLTYLLGNKEPT